MSGKRTGTSSSFPRRKNSPDQMARRTTGSMTAKGDTYGLSGGSTARLPLLAVATSPRCRSHQSQPPASAQTNPRESRSQHARRPATRAASTPGAAWCARGGPVAARSSLHTQQTESAPPGAHNPALPPAPPLISRINSAHKTTNTSRDDGVNRRQTTANNGKQRVLTPLT